MIKKIVLVSLISLISVTSLFAFDVNKEVESLTDYQKENIKKVIKIGDRFEAKDGTKFGMTLASLMGQESSFGKEKFNTIAQNANVDISKKSFGWFHFHIETAKDVIEKANLVQYKNLDDRELAYKLLHDNVFSTVLAGHFLVYNYNKTLDMNFKNPWRAAVSRHNGGYRNPIYLSKISRRFEVVKEVLKEDS